MPLILMEAPSSAVPPWSAGAGQTTSRRGGDLMRVYTTQHQFYGGMDLHARTMYGCMLNRDGEVLLHRHLQAAPEPFLKAVAPHREDFVVCVEWTVHLGPGSLISVSKRGCPSFWATPAPGKPSTAAQPNTTRSMPIRLRHCGAVACSPTPMSSRPRCVPPAPWCDAVCT